MEDWKTRASIKMQSLTQRRAFKVEAFWRETRGRLKQNECFLLWEWEAPAVLSSRKDDWITKLFNIKETVIEKLTARLSRQMTRRSNSSEIKEGLRAREKKINLSNEANETRQCPWETRTERCRDCSVVGGARRGPRGIQLAHHHFQWEISSIMQTGSNKLALKPLHWWYRLAVKHSSPKPPIRPPAGAKSSGLRPSKASTSSVSSARCPVLSPLSSSGGQGDRGNSHCH